MIRINPYPGSGISSRSLPKVTRVFLVTTAVQVKDLTEVRPQLTDTHRETNRKHRITLSEVTTNDTSVALAATLKNRLEPSETF